MTEEEKIEAALANQVPEYQEQPNNPTPSVEETPKIKNAASQYLGGKLTHEIGKPVDYDEDADKTLAQRKGLSKIGDSIGQNIEVREGWIPVEKELFGDRAKFYPEDWQFYIRPATVEAIRNWSVIDDENPNSVDDVFNEIIKSCVSIKSTSRGIIPWGQINSWDRFFLLLLVREYTFKTGETKIKYEEDCSGCDNPVEFELNSQSLMYEFPDEEVMEQYSQEERAWHIDPRDYDVNAEPITLFVPTLEKEMNIKNWLIGTIRENRNKKIDQVFLKFLPWMSPKFSKDETINKRNIRQIELEYKSWDMDMFGFMDDVLKNIIVTPSTKLTTVCPVCGEEVTSNIRFPNSIRDLFYIKTGRKKFGKKE